MYDSLVDNYRVIYEGALAPIFYKRFHPTHIEGDKAEHEGYRKYAFSSRIPSSGSKAITGRPTSTSPARRGLLQAVEYVWTAGGLPADARIVGVGNTPEDMIAYKAAGIESVLALWGVPDWLREYAERHWGADHCFGSMAEFARWCGCL